MWVRKSQEEIKQIFKKKKLLRFNPLFSVFISISVGLYEFGVYNSFSDLISSIIFVFVISYIGQVLFFNPMSLFVLIGYEPFSSESDICISCKNIIAKSINQKVCSCGGIYEPLENWKWQNE